MRFSVSYANTSRVERYVASGALAPVVGAQDDEHCETALSSTTRSCAVVSLTDEEREALPFRSLPSLDCSDDLNCLSSTQSPALEASPCVSSVPRSDSVARWQQIENQYLYNQDIAEQRVVILIQEAYRASLSRLAAARDAEHISHASYLQLRTQIQDAAAAVKTEYRRTLLRCKERKGPACETASLASKAVTCLASVYPWSSDGFFLRFSENNLFQSILESPPSSLTGSPPVAVAVLCSPSISAVVQPSESSVTRPSAADGKPTLPATTHGSGAVATQPLRPPRALQRLPPKKQTFQQVQLADNSAAIREVAPPARPPTQRLQVPGSPMPGVAACGMPSSPAAGCAYHDVKAVAAAPTFATAMPPAELNHGLIRPEERRYFERNQLAFGMGSFCVRSLASMSFVGYRRSNIAQWQARQRVRSSRAAAITMSVDSQNTSLGNSFFSNASDDLPATAALSPPHMSASACRREREREGERAVLASL